MTFALDANVRRLALAIRDDMREVKTQVAEVEAASGTGGGDVVISLPWTSVTEKPATFPPEDHSHAISDVTGLQDALDGKQPATAFKTLNGLAITGTGDIEIPSGAPGQSWTVTVVTTQAAFDAATPGPLELVVRV